jgi:putative phosphoesterase
MQVAILSDIHDHVWNLAAALAAVQSTDALICCGDLCSPFIIHQLGREYAQPVHIVFGNNDADLYRITSNARHYPHIHLHGEIYRGELDGRRFAAQHYDSIARTLAASGEFDVVCYGHNHMFDVSTIGATLGINPGPIMGMAFHPDGRRKEVPATYAIYDTKSGEASRRAL